MVDDGVFKEMFYLFQQFKVARTISYSMETFTMMSLGIVYYKFVEVS